MHARRGPSNSLCTVMNSPYVTIGPRTPRLHSEPWLVFDAGHKLTYREAPGKLSRRRIKTDSNFLIRNAG